MTSKQRRDTAKGFFDEILSTPPAPYTSKYSNEKADILKKISDRGEYSYDSAKDSSFRQYKKDYSQAGKKAFEDSVAAANALSGGRKNSYAKKAGALGYGQYLKKADNALKDFEDVYYNRYASEEANDIKLADALSDAQKREYDRYNDEVKRYYKTLDYWAKMAKYF